MAGEEEQGEFETEKTVCCYVKKRRKEEECLRHSIENSPSAYLRIWSLNCKCESSGPNPLIPLWGRVLVVLLT